MISLYVEVYSSDAWDRHSLQGYGRTCVSNSTGHCRLTIKTVKPSPTSLLDALRRYFIGGYVKPLPLPQGTHCSQFGYQTTSSGTVSISLDVIHQRHIVHTPNTYGVSLSVQAVSDAYRRVQARAMKEIMAASSKTQ
jgi:hypothetical protein